MGVSDYGCDRQLQVGGSDGGEHGQDGAGDGQVDVSEDVHSRDVRGGCDNGEDDMLGTEIVMRHLGTIAIYGSSANLGSSMDTF